MAKKKKNESPIKKCRGCKNEYNLKTQGKYCPTCGKDYYDGAVSGNKYKCNEENIKKNNCTRHADGNCHLC